MTAPTKWRQARRWSRCGLAAVAVVVAFATGPAAAEDDAGIISFQVENDVIAGTDRGYTNGLLLSYFSPETRTADHLSRRIADRIPLIDPDDALRFGLGIGHNIYTPEDKRSRRLVADDRPYAGWLYLSFSLLSYQEHGDDFGLSGNFGLKQSLVLDIGVVGPWAQGETVQNDWHNLIGVGEAKGWDNQLKNEPGINLTYVRTWRYQTCCHTVELFDIDVMPSLGVTLGNVMTYGSAGLMFRLGQGLDQDFGAPRIRPSLPGSGYFAPKGFGWYLFAGVEGRVVGRNIFLDGNTFRDSHSVDKRYLVGDAQAGLALTVGNFRVSYTHVVISPEARGLDSHQFGAVALSWRIVF